MLLLLIRIDLVGRLSGNGQRTHCYVPVESSVGRPLSAYLAWRGNESSFTGALRCQPATRFERGRWGQIRKVGDEMILIRRLPALPAGPWFSAPSMLGKALCLHNLLVEVGHYLKRHDRRS